MCIIMLLPLLIILALSSGAALWIIYAFPKTLANTFGLFAFCQSLFIKCAEYISFIKLLALWCGALLVFTGLAYALLRAAASIIKARQAIKRLPVKDNGGRVVLINDNALNAAFTYGLVFPRIYISKGLLENLDREEMMGVFLHELHHKKRFDPLRFFILNFLKDVFFYIPMAGYFIGRIRIKKELEADDAVVAVMKEPVSLAGALLKAASFGAAACNPAATHLTGGKDHSANGGAVEARIKRLIEGVQIRFAAPRPAPVAASLLAAGFVAIAFSLSFNSGIRRECTPKHCAIHINKLGDDCKTHCELSRHSHSQMAGQRDG